MAEINLSKYGITGTTEIVHNPSYELLFEEETKAGLTYGKGLMELLKQPLGHPLSLADMVFTLVGATGRKFVDIPTEDTKKFQNKMLAYMNENYSQLVNTIEQEKVLEAGTREQILEAIDEFKKIYQEG